MLLGERKFSGTQTEQSRSEACRQPWGTAVQCILCATKWSPEQVALRALFRAADTLLPKDFGGFCGCRGAALLEATNSKGRVRNQGIEAGKEQEHLPSSSSTLQSFFCVVQQLSSKGGNMTWIKKSAIALD